jgi:calcineurin-like phosphoesterase family protein
VTCSSATPSRPWPCWTGHRKLGSWPQRYADAGFTVLPAQIELELAGLVVGACHFPYAGDSGNADRYAQHRPADLGGWLLHGHVHERWRQRGRMINVGMDVWDYAPVSADTIAALVKDGPTDLDRSGQPVPASGS